MLTFQSQVPKAKGMLSLYYFLFKLVLVNFSKSVLVTLSLFFNLGQVNVCSISSIQSGTVQNFA